MKLYNFLSGVLMSGLFLAVFVVASTHTAPMGDFVGTPAEAAKAFADMPVNEPVYSDRYSKQFPNCIDIADRNDSTVYPSVLIVDQMGDVKVMPFDKVWRMVTNDATADDVWVVGVCENS